jgi:radical SAM superfamily enzyme YgiQ (UPF0313 family)
VSVLLLSTYDLGRQPFGLASPAAWFRRAGIEVVTRDLSRDTLAEDDVRRASLIAFYLPMHTATRLAVPAIDRVQRLNRGATVAAYGLYAPLAESLLRAHGVSIILGPEAEADLVAIATSLETPVGVSTGELRSVGDRSRQADVSGPDPARPVLPRLEFLIPAREGLPSLDRYATVQMPDGAIRVAGATDATRGCKHRCRHCPIVPVYDGQFRVVPLEVVIADVDQQVAVGAGHITFGDPDFFNGPTHARRLVERLHERHPALTYDVTIKIEHLLHHRALLPLLAETGCLFITSAVESIDDDVLLKLEKGHTRADFVAAVALCREAGVVLVPTFVAFTPWTTLDGYRELLATIEGLDLVEHVATVQWGLRLLITQGSRLLELEDIRARVGTFNERTLTYPWHHGDPQVDALQSAILREVGTAGRRSRSEMFAAVCKLAGVSRASEPPRRNRTAIPYLDEPWYC